MKHASTHLFREPRSRLDKFVWTWVMAGSLALLVAGCSREAAPEPSADLHGDQPSAKKPTNEQEPDVSAARETPAKEDASAPDAKTAPIQGIRVTTVPGIGDDNYSIYDDRGKTRLRERAEANTVVPVDPGCYTLKQPYSEFPYASDVVVKPGEVIVVPMGAIKLVTVPDALFGDYHIFDKTGDNRLREHNAANTLVTAPPGRFVLKQKYSPFTYAAEIVVKAGEVTVVEMGALRYNAPHDYHVFDAEGTNRLREHGKPGELVTAPPGRYVLKKAYSDIVLSDDVNVTAGTITEVE